MRVLTAFLLLATPAFAELPPEVYLAMQQASPEVLHIEILSVDIDRDFHKPDGCVRHCEGFVGPRSIPLLYEKDRVYAYLTKTNRGFEPAARGASFESMR